MKERFREWTSELDLEACRSSNQVGSWVAAAIAAAIIIVVCGVLPTRRFFQLDALLATACGLPAFVYAFAFALRLKLGTPISPMAWGIHGLIVTLSLQFFTGALVAFSELPGAAALAGMHVFTTAVHGQNLYPSLRHPFALVSSLLALVFAALLNPEPAHLALFGVAGPVAIIGAIVLGRNALGARRAHSKQAALRAAVDAQILAERSKHLERASEVVNALRSHNHDAGSTLSSIYLNVQLLAERSAAPSVGPEQLREMHEMSVDLKQDLERLSQLMSSARDVGNNAEVPSDIVDVDGALTDAIGTAHKRFPQVDISVQRADGGVRIPMRGGGLSLYRVFENLIVNACEGDGQRGARRVVVGVKPLGTGVEVVIEDDGPGFPQSLLGTPVSGFATTKPNGTGLGLYTAERLLQASGGQLRLGNGARAGAKVSVALRGGDA